MDSILKVIQGPGVWEDTTHLGWEGGFGWISGLAGSSRAVAEEARS